MDYDLGLDKDLINTVKCVIENKESLKEQLEELDELSKTTLGSYIRKAHASGKMSYGDAKDSAPHDVNLGTDKSRAFFAKSSGDTAKRDKGIARAVNKLTNEQLEEIESLAIKHGLGE